MRVLNLAYFYFSRVESHMYLCRIELLKFVFLSILKREMFFPQIKRDIKRKYSISLVTIVSQKCLFVFLGIKFYKKCFFQINVLFFDARIIFHYSEKFLLEINTPHQSFYIPLHFFEKFFYIEIL